MKTIPSKKKMVQSGAGTDDRRREEVKFSEKNQAALEFELSWETEAGRHEERRLVPRADLWRDVVHPALAERLAGAVQDQSFTLTFPAGEAVPPYDDREVAAVPMDKVRFPVPRCGEKARFGRFYPRGVLGPSGLFFSEDVRPFRVAGIDGSWIIADWNHPLARFPLSLAVRVRAVRRRGNMLGGSCVDLLEEVTGGGPGMEAPWKGKITDFGGPEGLRRESEDADRLFYADPRLVGHVDRQASDFLAHEYSRAIPEGARVLDLMSSVESHLPAESGLEVTGLGLNDEELRSNPLLVERTVHDLNVEAELPFGDDTFDAVVCSLSYEYLTRPVEVAAEVRRVLRAGGVFLVGLSNRWFPPKVTKIWTQLHEFERLGMVLEHLRAAGFEGLRTVTVQNWPRPADDPHYPRIRLSDPVYLASGVKIR